MSETSVNRIESAGVLLSEELGIYESKLETRRRLARIDPSNLQWRWDEAQLLGLIGSEYSKARMPGPAITAHEESSLIWRELVERDPRNFDLQRHLSACLTKLSKVKLDAGDIKAALLSQEECILINRRLNQRDPSQAQSVATAENLASLGDLRFECSDNLGALEIYEELLSIERDLVKDDPRNTSLRWNLSGTLVRIGETQLALREPKMALLAYEESLTIRNQLLELDQTDAQLLEDVAWNQKKVGDVKRQVRNVEAELEVEESL